MRVSKIVYLGFITRLKAYIQREQLMGALALAFTWCLIAGHWHYGEAKDLPLNKHWRPAKALFRLGLDMLRRVLLNKESKNDPINFLILLQVLSRT